MSQRIFVTIASYMDHELVPTVRSAVERAADPDRLSFGIVDQSITDGHAALTALSHRVAYVRVHPRDSLGCCWARSLGQTLYDGEEVALQIDSHMRFDSDWDETLVAALAAAQADAGHARVLLSTLPSGFNYDAAGQIVEQLHRARKLAIAPHVRWNPEIEPAPRSEAVPFDGDAAIPGRLIAAGFLAGPGAWIEALPYDPMLYFHGEELALALRAFTWGWDVYHPAIVPVRHLYKQRRDRGVSLHHWDGMFEASRRFTAAELEARSRARLADLVAGRVHGVHGIGPVRSATDFWREAGINLAEPAG